MHNPDFIKICTRKYGLDLSSIDDVGFSELHKIVDMVSKDSTKLPIIGMWLSADLPFDIKSSKKAGIHADKTPLVLAMELADHEVKKQGNQTGLHKVKDNPEDSIMYDVVVDLCSGYSAYAPEDEAETTLSGQDG